MYMYVLLYATMCYGVRYINVVYCPLAISTSLSPSLPSFSTPFLSPLLPPSLPPSPSYYKTLLKVVEKKEDGEDKLFGNRILIDKSMKEFESVRDPEVNDFRLSLIDKCQAAVEVHCTYMCMYIYIYIYIYIYCILYIHVHV